MTFHLKTTQRGLITIISLGESGGVEKEKFNRKELKVGTKSAK